MKNRFKVVAAAILAIMLACPVQAAVDNHIVTRVEVALQQPHSMTRRQYTQEKKMEAVLNYLRLAKYAGMPNALPGNPQADHCRITVHLAPGGSHIYDLLDWQYLSRDGNAWELAEMPEGFLLLLEALPSDA